MAKVPAGVGPRFPQVVVLVGATGDLARRKLIPGLLHLATAGFIPGCRIVGVSLDELDADGIPRVRARRARRILRAQGLRRRLERVRGHARLRTAEGRRRRARRRGGRAPSKPSAPKSRRLHYLSVPPNAALVGGAHARRSRPGRQLAHHHGEAVRHGSRERRGAQRQAARGVRRGADLPHRSLPRQGAGAEHPRVPFRQRPVRADLESQLHRPRADRRARDARPRQALGVLRIHRRVSRHGRHAPVPDPRASWRWRRRRTSRRSAISEEKNKVFRSMLPIQPADVVRGQYTGYRSEEGVSRGIRHRDLHRAQVLDRQLALGRRAVLSAHRQAAGRGPAHHLDRVSRAAEEHVSRGLRHRRARAGSPDLRSRRRREARRCRSTASGRGRA